MLPAPTFKCPPDLNVLVMQTERQCHVPCPGECIMTDWTPWNTCFITCEDFHTEIVDCNVLHNHFYLSELELRRLSCGSLE
ncbi:hypothetical protein KUTeg_015447 [Tegillarca granosa]|uniref:Uncharacterized protein n=1 Tax=Tegillarca granosa TaxID=220873 RepID=A0ABQ9EVN2_TEGGR|nr:hypothetical protein KUTeg_015447 [Tegillarca granosa]